MLFPQIYTPYEYLEAVKSETPPLLRELRGFKHLNLASSVYYNTERQDSLL